jgi:hypothetical protein
MGGGWHEFGNSPGRSMSASARTAGNAMGGGWHSFGNLRPGVGSEMSRAYASNVRTDGQWHSFGNSRHASFGANVSGLSSFRASREAASYTHAPRMGFNWNRFSTNWPGSSRFSSFSSGRSMENFGRYRFGSSGPASLDFGNSVDGISSFSNSLIGSNVSLIPNLLLGGLLRLGTSVFGGGGILGGSALSFAARSFGLGLASNGFNQGGFAGGEFGIGRGGFSWDFGFQEAPVCPARGAGASFWGPGSAWSGYCGPYPYYPLGWSGSGYFGNSRIGYDVTDAGSAHSDVD